jgi:hypothetical protein
MLRVEGMGCGGGVFQTDNPEGLEKKFISKDTTAML